MANSITDDLDLLDTQNGEEWGDNGLEDLELSPDELSGLKGGGYSYSLRDLDDFYIEDDLNDEPPPYIQTQSRAPRKIK